MIVYKHIGWIYLIGIVLCIGFSGCVDKSEKEPTSNDVSYSAEKIPDVYVLKSNIEFNTKSSFWIRNKRRYSGYIVSYYQDSVLKEKIGVLKGRFQGLSQKWYSDGHLKEVANYQNGKLQGEKKNWSSDKSHVLISQLNYHSGKVHGNQKIWYATGELFKNLNLNMGKEEGIQQAFRKNGALYANYEARAGRIFGMKKAALCYDIENGVIKSQN